MICTSTQPDKRHIGWRTVGLIVFIDGEADDDSLIKGPVHLQSRLAHVECNPERAAIHWLETWWQAYPNIFVGPIHINVIGGVS
jgi:hypothetical protein